MFDGPLMLRVNLLKVDTVHSKGNKFVMGVKIKATYESKLDSPGLHQLAIQLYRKKHFLTLQKPSWNTVLIISLLTLDQTSLIYFVICFVKIKQYERKTVYKL